MPITDVSVALFVRLEAKPGKKADVAEFLRDGLPIVQDEPATVTWFGIRLGPSTFGIFDAFPDDAGRLAHLQGAVAGPSGRRAPCGSPAAVDRALRRAGVEAPLSDKAYQGP